VAPIVVVAAVPVARLLNPRSRAGRSAPWPGRRPCPSTWAPEPCAGRVGPPARHRAESWTIRTCAVAGAARGTGRAVPNRRLGRYVAGPVCVAPDRLARPRPRLGDRGRDADLVAGRSRRDWSAGLRGEPGRPARTPARQGVDGIERRA
jgi:hypothetical protein